MSYKSEIVKLRKEGKSYREIENILGCSRSTISYHCKNEGLEDVGLENKRSKLKENEISDIKEFYQDHTRRETAKRFNISQSTVSKYCSKNGEFDKRNTDCWNGSVTSKRGKIAEIEVISSLLRNDYHVSEPITEDCRYDLIADDGNMLYKVQVKMAHDNFNGSFSFNCCSKTDERVPYRKENIDVFCVYFDKFENVYWICIEDTPDKTMTLRYNSPNNNQSEGINYASDFKL